MRKRAARFKKLLLLAFWTSTCIHCHQHIRVSRLARTYVHRRGGHSNLNQKAELWTQCAYPGNRQVGPTHPAGRSADRKRSWSVTVGPTSGQNVSHYCHSTTGPRTHGHTCVSKSNIISSRGHSNVNISESNFAWSETRVHWRGFYSCFKPTTVSQDQNWEFSWQPNWHSGEGWSCHNCCAACCLFHCFIKVPNLRGRSIHPATCPCQIGP